jgi:hypothetical protein
MSAGVTNANLVPNRNLAALAPKFHAAVDRAIAACNADGLDAFVFEGYRSRELQEAYYARGRWVIPPHHTVTNARSNLYSWHGYGLAVDVISRAKAWSVEESWFERVAAHFKAEGCKWGGDWKMRDLPHFQWGRCKPSPSPLARELFASGGLPAVWDACKAA